MKMLILTSSGSGRHRRCYRFSHHPFLLLLVFLLLFLLLICKWKSFVNCLENENFNNNNNNKVMIITNNRTIIDKTLDGHNFSLKIDDDAAKSSTSSSSSSSRRSRRFYQQDFFNQQDDYWTSSSSSRNFHGHRNFFQNFGDDDIGGGGGNYYDDYYLHHNFQYHQRHRNNDNGDDDDFRDNNVDNSDENQFSGPWFSVEPGPETGTNPGITGIGKGYRGRERKTYYYQYNNETLSIILTCQANGYPKPKIYWRVDNVTMLIGSNGAGTNAGTNGGIAIGQLVDLDPFSDESIFDFDYNNNNNDDGHNGNSQQQYWPNLNAIVTIKNDGQTLIIGGGIRRKDGAHNNYQATSSSASASNFYSSNSYYSHNNNNYYYYNSNYFTISHQIECLAINRFGSIISRPIIIQQQVLIPNDHRTSASKTATTTNQHSNNSNNNGKFSSSLRLLGPRPSSSSSSSSLANGNKLPSSMMVHHSNSVRINGGGGGGPGITSGNYFGTFQPFRPSASYHQEDQDDEEEEEEAMTSIHLQSYDEFVSRGNVAVLKCLVNHHHHPHPHPHLHQQQQQNDITSSSSSNFHSKTSSGLAGSNMGQEMNVQQQQQQQQQHHHLHYLSYSSSSASSSSSLYHHHQQQQQQQEQNLGIFYYYPYTFEWRIKNGPAAVNIVQPQPIDNPVIIKIRSNQTQGKYTAYPSGELHVRDVDEHDARRTYQCAIYRSKTSKTSQHPSSSSASSSSSSTIITTATTSPTSQQQQQGYDYSNYFHTQQRPQQQHLNDQQPLAESTFAQIILSGGEKDIFPPRIIHRLDELYANEGQYDPLLIPCAAHSYPLPTYQWYWIPFGHQIDWEKELQELLLEHQQKASNNNNNNKQQQQQQQQHTKTMAIPIDQYHSNQQYGKFISKIKPIGSGSTLLLTGPINKHIAGHYISIISNTVGYDKCITTLNIRSKSSLEIFIDYSLSSSSSSSKYHSNSDADLKQQQKKSKQATFTTNNNNDNLEFKKSQQQQPRRRRKPPKIIRAIRGEIIRLKCVVYNGFPLTNLYWLHNTVFLKQNLKHHQQQKTQKQKSFNFYHRNDNYYDEDPYDNDENDGFPFNYNSHNINKMMMKKEKTQHQRYNDNDDDDISAIKYLDILLDDKTKSGMYQCFAKNHFETIQSTIQIQVIDQPPSIVEHFNELTIKPGENFALRCISSGSPLAQIEWSLDRMPVPTSNRYRYGDFVIKDPTTISSSSSSAKASTLSAASKPSSSIESLLVSYFNVTSARIEDGGLYRCLAKNTAGYAYYQARVNIIGKGSVKNHTPNLTTLSGMDFELNCPYYGYPIKSISWFGGKDGSKRKLPTNGRQHISSNGTLHISKINKKEDEGSYECEVTFQMPSSPSSAQNDQTSRTKLYLNIINGPRIDNFTFASNLEEGMRSTVVCAVISGDPPIHIYWLKDGQPLITSKTLNNNNDNVKNKDNNINNNNNNNGNFIDRKIEMVNEFTSSITFNSLKRKHAGRYTCIASNKASTDYHYADLKVNVPPVWLYEPKDIQAISGQILIIDCQAEGIPDPQVRWKIEELPPQTTTTSATITTGTADNSKLRKLSSSSGPLSGSSASAGSSGIDSNKFHTVISNPHIQILENGSLLIKEINRNDHRRYMCSAFNGVGTGISTIIRLSVNFPPQFLDGFYETKQSKLGEMIILTCLIRIEYIDDNINNNKTNNDNNNGIDSIDIRWFKDVESTRKILPKYENLISLNSNEQSSLFDRYHITSLFEITNSDSSILSTFNLTTTQFYSMTQKFLPTGTGTITTTGTGNGLVGETSNSNSNNIPTARYYASKLSIRHTDRIDNGVYQCWASNKYGMIKKNFTLKVLEHPDRPEEIRADEITSTTIKLSWPIPYDGNQPIIEYVIAYRTISGSISNTITLAPYAATYGTTSGSSSSSSSGPSTLSSSSLDHNSKRFVSYQLNNLIPSTAYVVQVKAKNSIGFSQFSDSITVKTAEEPPNNVPTDITILPLNTKSLKISWRPPRKPSSNNNNGKNIYTPPITGYYIGYRQHLDHHQQEHNDNDNDDGHHQKQKQQQQQNEFIFKTIKSNSQSDLNSNNNDETYESFILTNLKRATRYDIKIQAFNLAGAGPSSSEYLGKTLDFDVPSAPRIRALKSNLTSIELMWSVEGEEPINGFILSYKPSSATTTTNEMIFNNNNNENIGNGFGTSGKQQQPAEQETIMTTTTMMMNEWKTIKIELEPIPMMMMMAGGGIGGGIIDATHHHHPNNNNNINIDDDNNNNNNNVGNGNNENIPIISTFQRRTYVLNDLRCGTKYFIYINAYNGAGQGDPSEVILSRTEGNIPIAPDHIDEFIQTNITRAKIFLNQWKILGCPIEKFELDYHIYDEPLTNRKLIIKPNHQSTMTKTTVTNDDDGEDNDDDLNKSSSSMDVNQTNQTKSSANVSSTTTTTTNNELIIELNNLLPASWYELIIKTITEAGIVQKDYLFSTQQIDGSTIAPLMLKVSSMDQHETSSSTMFGRANQQRSSSNSNGFLGTGTGTGSSSSSSSFVHTFRSNIFTHQLHYIVPVSCTLVILFLVFIVVCAIQTNNRNNFMFSLVSANNHHQHRRNMNSTNNVIDSNVNTNDIIDDNGTGADGGCIHHQQHQLLQKIINNPAAAVAVVDSNNTNMILDGNGAGLIIEQNQATDHIYGTANHHPHHGHQIHYKSSKLMGSNANSIDELLENSNTNGQQQRYTTIRTDSCHSLGLITATANCQQITPNKASTDNMNISLNNNNKQQQQQYPLYSLPVPYATSSVKFTSNVQDNNNNIGTNSCANNNGSGGGDNGPTSNNTTNNNNGNGIKMKYFQRKSQQQQKLIDPLYGTLVMNSTNTNNNNNNNNNRQFTEMYCDGPTQQQQKSASISAAAPPSLLLVAPPPPPPSSSIMMDQQQRQWIGHHSAASNQQQQQQQSSTSTILSSGSISTASTSSSSGTHQQQLQQQHPHPHQYELPFVFKPVPQNHNESTAF